MKDQIYAYTLRGTEEDMRLVLFSYLEEIAKDLEYVGVDLSIVLKSNPKPMEILNHIRKLRTDLVKQDLHLEDAESIYSEMVQRELGLVTKQSFDQKEKKDVSKTDENE